MFYTKGLEYIIPFIVVFVLSTVFLVFARKNLLNADTNTKLLPVKIAFFVLVALEIVKIFLLIGENKLLSNVRYPVVFCSISMYAYGLFCFKNNKLSSVGMSMAVVPSLIAGLIFFVNPGDLFVKGDPYFGTAVMFFINCHSFFYHAVIAAIAIYLPLVKLYEFKFVRHLETAAGMAFYLLFCLVVSLVAGDISIFGVNSGFVGWLFSATGYATGILIITIFFFFFSAALYKIIDLVVRKKQISQPNNLPNN